ncbi:MAG: hypothetical protein KC635_13705, partial [Myxococcales bacterium]|nr:hypothetical protein [Myxococcales bacterium]
MHAHRLRLVIVAGLAASAVLAACDQQGGGEPCIPGNQYCSDDGLQALECNAAGDAKEVIATCSADLPCQRVSGAVAACGEGSCEPNKRFCQGLQILGCSAAGVPTGVVETCGANEACRIEAGVATCVGYEPCTPGAVRCNATASAVEQCRADGQGFEVQLGCDSGERCVPSGSLAGCEAIVPTCEDDLGCRLGEYCDLATHHCVAQVCTPLARSCSADGDILQCDGHGAGTVLETECTDGQTCTGSGASTACRCITAASQACYDGDVYAVDSCGERGQRVQNCAEPETCSVVGGVADCRLRATCEVDAHCPAGNYCDTATGACAARTCTPSSRECQGGDVWACDNHGAAFALETECVGGQACAVVGGSVSCRCGAGQNACYDGDVYAFDSCGTRLQRVENCTEPEICGVVDGAAACALRTTCSQDAHCPTGNYCDTVAGECKPRVCTPGATSCQGGDVWQCDDHGAATELLTDCAGGQVCTTSGGPHCACTSSGARGCYDGDVYNLDSCGNRLNRYDACTEPETCVEDGGTATCRLRPTCTSNAECYSSQFCDVASGACRPDVCSFTGAYCNGALVQQCRPDGSGVDTNDTCTGGEVCVTLSTTSAQCRCAPNAYLGCSDTDIWWFDSCGARKTRSEYCTEPEVCQTGGDGQPFCSVPLTCAADTGCASGYFCQDATCTPWLCTPGQRVCDGARVLACNARGSAWEAYDDCVGGEVCDASGGAAVCRCTPNAYLGCWNGNVERFNSCGVPTSVAQSCP